MSKCEMFDNYKKQEWLDEIVDVDDRGNVVYERDENGDVVYLTDHFGRPLHNPFTGEPIPKVKLLQEGTRITARRMEHFEKHLCSLYGWKNVAFDSIEYLMIMMEIQSQVEGGQGTFFDDIGNLTKNMVHDDVYTTLSHGADEGDKVLKVADSRLFEVGETLHLYDDEKYTTGVIERKPNNTQIELSDGVGVALKKDAFVSRSSAVVDREEKRLVPREWVTYDISSEVV